MYSEINVSPANFLFQNITVNSKLIYDETLIDSQFNSNDDTFEHTY